LKKKNIILILLCIGLLAGVCFFIIPQLTGPKIIKGEKVLINIKSGSGLLEIANTLEKNGIIKNKYIFTFYALLQGKQSGLKAGTYLLSPSSGIAEITRKLWEGESAKVKVTIPEGYRVSEIESVFSSKMKKPSYETAIRNKKAASYKEDFNFLKEVPNDKGLEGFLFPDTYHLKTNSTPDDLTKAMLSNFKIKALPLIKESEKDLWETIIMASLLEKEVIGLEDKKIASGVLQKRIEIGMPLQVDAAIVYITGGRSTNISQRDKEIDSPYNTYKYRGLPAGPICNPGIESIRAALEPQGSDYWYYLTTKEGKTIFSKTLIEHNINKNKYLSR